MKKRIWKEILWAGTTAIGSALFALGFAMFLIPNDINTGGISGLAMILRELLGFGSIGTLIISIPKNSVILKWRSYPGTGQRNFTLSSLHHGVLPITP